MPLNVKSLCDLMELYAGRGGVNRDRINRKLLYQIINLKLKDFAVRTGLLESKATIKSQADQQEYELPPDVIHIKSVKFDNYRAYKILYEEVAEIAGKES